MKRCTLTGFILKHPVVDKETKQRAGQLRSELESSLPEEGIEERGNLKDMSIESVVEGLQERLSLGSQQDD